MSRTLIIPRRRAFTLVELLVVILVIAILLALALPSLLGHQAKAQDSAVAQGLTLAFKAAKVASLDNDPEGAWATPSSTPGLVADINDSEPQLAVIVTDDPGSGRYGVCADSSAQTLKLVAHSASGHAFLLTAPAKGRQTITRGTCHGPEDGATFADDLSGGDGAEPPFEHVAFVARANPSTYEVMVAGLDGRGARSVHSFGTAFWGAFAPAADGSFFALDGSDPDTGDGTLMRFDADGGNATAVVENICHAAGIDATLDGAKVAVGGCLNEHAGEVRIFDTRTGELLATVTGAYATDSPVLRPAISPDGTKVLVPVICTSGTAVCVGEAPITGGQATPLIDSTASDVFLLYGYHWTPDGRHVLVGRQAADDAGYYAYSASGAPEGLVSPEVGSDFFLPLPAGGYLYAGMNEDNTAMGLYTLASANGTPSAVDMPPVDGLLLGKLIR